MTADLTTARTRAETSSATVTPVAVESQLPTVTDPDAPGEWIAVHVFYSSNNHPLLTDVVGPVVEELREEGLLDGWFFIRYWMEGPHIRVRLRPRRAGDTHAVADRLFAALDTFLAERPALYEMDAAEMGDLFKEMFLGEYSIEQWDALYGEQGHMPMRPNNSYAVMAYEPELARYGGPEGIDVAEWHFEQSSDMALRLVESTNVHVRSVLFGLAAQLMTVMLGVFQRDRTASAEFLTTYRTYWERSGSGDSSDRHAAYKDAYDAMSGELHEQLGHVYEASARHDVEALSGFLGIWAEHCIELRRRLLALADAGRLSFPIGRDTEPRPVDADTALFALLSGYVHMTNNRLGVSMIDECYLSYLIGLVLTDGDTEALEVNLDAMFGGTGADR